MKYMMLLEGHEDVEKAISIMTSTKQIPLSESVLIAREIITQSFHQMEFIDKFGCCQIRFSTAVNFGPMQTWLQLNGISVKEIN